MSIQSLQFTEVLLIISLLVSFISILLLFTYKPAREFFRPSKPSVTVTKEEPKKENPSIIEVFDYLGTKIIHEGEKYTVNHKGVVTVYSSWESLPIHFKKMVQELDKRSGQQIQGNGYFLEVINGEYQITMPDGNRKKYKRLDQIPVRIRKMIGKY